MHNGFREIVFVAAALGLLVGRPAVAETSDAARSKAIAVAVRAASAYKAGRYADALSRFNEAYQLFPDPRLLSDMSHAAWKLGRCDEAVRDAQIYASTATPDASLSPARSPATWLERVQFECPEVDIATDPSGAALWVNGEQGTALGVTPWKGRVVAGSHSILARRPGWLDRHEPVTVAAGVPLHLALSLVPDAPPTPALRSAPLPVSQGAAAPGAPAAGSFLGELAPMNAVVGAVEQEPAKSHHDRARVQGGEGKAGVIPARTPALSPIESAARRSRSAERRW